MGKMGTEKKKGVLKKVVLLEKITLNESMSNRIARDFSILKKNRKLRKTIDYYGRKKSNNVLDPSIVLREKWLENDYYFVCMEGASRIMAMKKNKKIKYLKCSVLGARKGINEIKREKLVRERREKEEIRMEDYPREIEREYTKKPLMRRVKIPIMGKR